MCFLGTRTAHKPWHQWLRLKFVTKNKIVKTAGWEIKQKLMENNEELIIGKVYKKNEYIPKRIQSSWGSMCLTEMSACCLPIKLWLCLFFCTIFIMFKKQKNNNKNTIIIIAFSSFDLIDLRLYCSHINR